MAREITKGLVESWELGRTLPTRDNRDLHVVGKENGEIQLAKKMWGENNIEYIIGTYSLKNIQLDDMGGCVIKAEPTKILTKITREEYYGKKEPSNELNKKYLEILNSW